MTLIRGNNFEELVNSIYQTYCFLQENAIKAINYNLTVRNWLIGCYIFEFEQDGNSNNKNKRKCRNQNRHGKMHRLRSMCLGL